MSQRSALLLSLALTVLVGFAIVANRDRLLGASPATPQPTPAAQTTLQETTERGIETARQNPRIVEVTLPATQGNATGALTTSGGDEDDDRYEDEDDDDSDRYEHEDDDDNDREEHEEDDDDD